MRARKTETKLDNLTKIKMLLGDMYKIILLFNITVDFFICVSFLNLKMLCYHR